MIMYVSIAIFIPEWHNLGSSINLFSSSKINLISLPLICTVILGVYPSTRNTILFPDELIWSTKDLTSLSRTGTIKIDPRNAIGNSKLLTNILVSLLPMKSLRLVKFYLTNCRVCKSTSDYNKIHGMCPVNSKLSQFFSEIVTSSSSKSSTRSNAFSRVWLKITKCLSLVKLSILLFDLIVKFRFSFVWFLLLDYLHEFCKSVYSISLSD